MFQGYIMSADMPVASFNENVVSPILPDRSPLCFHNGGNLKWWLESRAIDKHRQNSRILKRILRLADTSDISAVIRVHGASITDNYWVKTSEEQDLQWADVKFLKNYFDEIALWGSFESYAKDFTSEQLKSQTPELTNIGHFEKCWRLENGVWTLNKRGTPEEIFSEVFIYKLGKYFGFNMAEYRVGDKCVISPDFTKGKYNFEPIANLVLDNEDYTFNFNALKSLKPGLEKEYLDILFMDALIFNVDRHTQNFGILRDHETGKIISMAPNYDNNMALISRGYFKNINFKNPLAVRFLQMLAKEQLSYDIPIMTNSMEADIDELIQSTMPEAQIRRDYVEAFVLRNYEYLRKQ